MTGKALLAVCTGPLEIGTASIPRLPLHLQSRRGREGTGLLRSRAFLPEKTQNARHIESWGGTRPRPGVAPSPREVTCPGKGKERLGLELNLFVLLHDRTRDGQKEQQASEATFVLPGRSNPYSVLVIELTRKGQEGAECCEKVVPYEDEFDFEYEYLYR